LNGAQDAGDPLGGLSTAAFSALPSLAVGLNSVGQTYTVGLSSGQSPVTGVSYGPLGIGSVTYGSGDSDTFSYKTSGLISNVKSTVGSSNYFSTPTWNTSGTLQKLVTDAGATVNYGYDDMGRISSASDGASIQQTYTYDQFGNLSTSGAPYSFLNGYTTGNHIITSGQCNGTGICYDADGNLLSDGDHAYTWDSLDRVSSIDGHTLTRDAFGRVVEGDGWNGSSMFFYSPYGRIDMSGQALLLASISLPGGGKMLMQPTSTEYDRPDFQGNVALQSNTNQTLRSGIVEYSPFGQTYNGVTDYGFNDGSTEALASWTFDTPSRLLHGKQGRWISPDPAGISAASLDNPQSLNAYAYASNDPLIFNDPSGLDSEIFSEGVDYTSVDVSATFVEVAVSIISLPNTIGGFRVSGETVNVTATLPPGPEPNNTTPWYKTCTAKALFSGAGSIAIDSIGLIPEAEGFTKVFENTAGYQLARAAGNSAGYRGVVATQYGMMAVAQGKGGAGLISGAFGLGDTSTEGRISTGLTVAGFIPGLGTAAATASIGVDGYKTWKAVRQCP
jgi:RHS repeat-associated protein